MKTSTLQVHDMLSVLSVDDVEKRIGDVPGVESVTVDFAAGRATVRYDETRLSNADIKSAVRRRGLDSRDTPAETTPDDTHAHPAPSQQQSASAPTAEAK